MCFSGIQELPSGLASWPLAVGMRTSLEGAGLRETRREHTRQTTSQASRTDGEKTVDVGLYTVSRFGLRTSWATARGTGHRNMRAGRGRTREQGGELGRGTSVICARDGPHKSWQVAARQRGRNWEHKAKNREWKCSEKQDRPVLLCTGSLQLTPSADATKDSRPQRPSIPGERLYVWDSQRDMGLNRDEIKVFALRLQQQLLLLPDEPVEEDFVFDVVCGQSAKKVLRLRRARFLHGGLPLASFEAAADELGYGEGRVRGFLPPPSPKLSREWGFCSPKPQTSLSCFLGG